MKRRWSPAKIDERVEALKTLLPWLHAHHAMIAAGRTTPRAQWESTYEPPPPGWVPPPPEPDCHGDCGHCLPFLRGERCDVRNEAWYVAQRKFSAKYRLWPISLSLQKLDRMDAVEVAPGQSLTGSLLARAVDHEYVEPWPEWNVENRERWAAAGLRWMAAEIPAELVPYHPVPMKRQPVESRLGEVAELRARRWSRDRIAKRLRMSARDVSALLRALAGRPERTEDADS